MRSLKVKVIGSGILSSLLVGVIWYSIASPDLTEDLPVENSEVGVQSPASAPSESQVTAAAPAVAKSSLETTKTDSSVFQDFSRKEALSRFALLSQKALLSPADHVVRNDLLKDEELIKSLKPILTAASQSSSEQQLQNSALDLLFASLQTDSRDMAVGILKDIVAYAGVENETLPQTERQQLAGIKAEVLMALSADSKFQDDLTSLFPGPVTGKIWQNVQDRQKSNLAESALSR